MAEITEGPRFSSGLTSVATRRPVGSDTSAIFSGFDPNSDVVRGTVSTITQNVISSGDTLAVASGSAAYANMTISGEVYGSVTYGKKSGGATDPTAIYNQYKQLLFRGDEDATSVLPTSGFNAVTFKRSKILGSVDPATFEFQGEAVNTSTLTQTFGGPRYAGASSGYYLYSDLGIVIKSGGTLGTVTYSSGSGTYTNTLTAPSSIQLLNSKDIRSTHYFVRVKNGEYNYSTNPSYTTGSAGEIQNSSFIDDPKTYITTVGLYSDDNELLAIAKLSKPIQKSRTSEVLIKVRLDF